MKKDPALGVLLDLDGYEFFEENGYWHKIEEKMNKLKIGIMPREQYQRRILEIASGKRTVEQGSLTL